MIAALVVIVGSTAGGIGTARAASSVTVNIWSWNVSGWAMNDGHLDNGMVDGAVNSIINRDADLVVLNEICWQQYKAIQSALADRGWPEAASYSRFAVQQAGICNGSDFGLAVFSKRNIESARTFVLPDDGTIESRVLLCVAVGADRNLIFCGTHLGYKAGKKAQLAAVHQHLDDYYAEGRTPIVAGDFNYEPDDADLNAWYHSSVNTAVNSGNTGEYRELDDTDPICLGYGKASTENNTNGACNQSSKIDLIFARHDQLRSGYTSNALAISTQCGRPCSDHRIVIGTATVAIG